MDWQEQKSQGARWGAFLADFTVTVLLCYYKYYCIS